MKPVKLKKLQQCNLSLCVQQSRPSERTSSGHENCSADVMRTLKNAQSKRRSTAPGSAVNSDLLELFLVFVNRDTTAAAADASKGENISSGPSRALNQSHFVHFLHISNRKWFRLNWNVLFTQPVRPVGPFRQASWVQQLVFNVNLDQMRPKLIVSNNFHEFQSSTYVKRMSRNYSS